MRDKMGSGYSDRMMRPFDYVIRRRRRGLPIEDRRQNQQHAHNQQNPADDAREHVSADAHDGKLGKDQP